ncbi:hypothetical protein BU23DRAFT_126158 [Bimuria novae-zelandiae CBS 107.79]|uniref:Uncharacterized protein n=1 Tax=Bimuria novae-zelandiae CBS 107.79 TaxID=1447943 RepID=A0A6A5VKF3_9PLEO|nr:hypothetical protein BU23DRAFT_126158 [Bimuria novae-zelandiae CBS 107.79]
MWSDCERKARKAVQGSTSPQPTSQLTHGSYISYSYGVAGGAGTHGVRGREKGVNVLYDSLSRGLTLYKILNTPKTPEFKSRYVFRGYAVYYIADVSPWGVACGVVVWWDMPCPNVYLPQSQACPIR